MKTVNKLVTLPVDLTREFVLATPEGTRLGLLDELKEYLVNEYLEEGGDIGEVALSEFVNLGAQFEIKNKATVEMTDDAYSEDEIEYVVYDSKGRELDSFSYEDELLAYIKQQIEEGHYGEDELNVGRKVEYTATYHVEAEQDVILTIPRQIREIEVEVPFPTTQTGGIDWSTKRDMELMQELEKIQQELNKRVLARHNENFPNGFPPPLPQTDELKEVLIIDRDNGADF